MDREMPGVIRLHFCLRGEPSIFNVHYSLKYYAKLIQSNARARDVHACDAAGEMSVS